MNKLQQAQEIITNATAYSYVLLPKGDAVSFASPNGTLFVSTDGQASQINPNWLTEDNQAYPVYTDPEFLELAKSAAECWLTFE